MKKAGLQNPVLTDRNCIRGRKSWVSKHPFAMPLTNKRLCVDAAGIGGRKVLLPGEVSRCREHREKSAAVVVGSGNEPGRTRRPHRLLKDQTLGFPKFGREVLASPALSGRRD